MSTGHQDENANANLRQMIQNLRHQSELKCRVAENTSNPLIQAALFQGADQLEKQARDLEVRLNSDQPKI